MYSLLKDVQYALRSLARKPTFTVVAVLTLALGTGANTAVFSVVSAVLLAPLPFPAPDKLFWVLESSQKRGLSQNLVSAADFLDWQAQSRSFSAIAACRNVIFRYTETGGAVRVDGLAVSPVYFKLFGLSPLLGRVFVAEDDQPGFDNVVVITKGFWRRAFASDPAIAGKSIRLDGRSYTVLGVVPDPVEIAYYGHHEVFKPLGWTDAQRHDRAHRDLYPIARLRDGVSPDQARAELQAISRHLSEEYPDTNANWDAELVSWRYFLFGDTQQQLLVLLSVAAVVLLIACLNLASLFSARLTARGREIATRLAIGASPQRLARQCLAESILVGLTGGVAALLCLTWTVPLLLKAIPFPLPRVDAVHMDARTVTFTVLISAAAGLIFGISPAIRAPRIDLQQMLQDSNRGSSGGRGQKRFLDALVIAEVGLSMVLLVGAGLLLRTLTALRSVDPGFRTDHVLVNTMLVLPTEKYDSAPKRIDFFTRLLEMVRALPGVVSAGGITALPLQGNNSTTAYRVSGDARPDRGGVFNVVTGGYFETLRIPLLRGRFFTAADNPFALKTAIVNQALADHDFPGSNPIGQRLFVAGFPMPLEIVGVVGNTHQFSLQTPPLAEIFTPFQQSDSSYLYVVVRSRGNPEDLASEIRRLVASIDPDQPVGSRTLAEQLDRALGQPRLMAGLLALFAALALLLAVLGIYGVTSYGVVQRTREFGIRAALGASPARILATVLKHTALLALAGIASGSIAALALTRFLSQFLFRVDPHDVTTFFLTAALLLAVALVGGSVPAFRAARITAMTAMRQE
jgi:putative ABC transport system permease protein